ncbi:MAG: type I-E CRISPR-associated protein Cse2/CasB [Spirochaetales bacterium]|uniref:Type I-E CRISPR-associated protein Cse2/CasB n=1 Tax=Candidatus Thalassospirochaeta sargassi TaxID=3119039 RepID=A0AAJ1IE10_9SPIO|nr:type I-E CRISPR-associated protein Cse2/CasB [Spirochaetales bacterium]
MAENFWMELYARFMELDKTRKNLLKRAVNPEDLIENPVFYELYRMENKEQHQRNQVMRIVFCLPYIKHSETGPSLGAAFARMEKNRPVVGEKRMIQLYRTSDDKKAMEQLRRLLKLAQVDVDGEKAVTVNWALLGRKLMFWNDAARRNILEDYYLAIKKMN